MTSRTQLADTLSGQAGDWLSGAPRIALATPDDLKIEPFPTSRSVLDALKGIADHDAVELTDLADYTRDLKELVQGCASKRTKLNIDQFDTYDAYFGVARAEGPPRRFARAGFVDHGRGYCRRRPEGSDA